MANTNKLLVIDCSQLCWSSFHSFPDLSYNEKKTAILFGFIMQLIKLAQDFDTKTFAFCFDSGRSFRKDIYPSYKFKRHNTEYTDEEKRDRQSVYMQIGELRQKVLPELGFKNVLIKTGLEADDLICYVADKNNGCTVVSNDGDMYQLLDRCEIYNTKTKMRMYEPDLIEVFGIGANKWGDVKSIAGCTTDEVEGIKGVAEKTAAKYLRKELPKGVVRDRIESKEGQEIIKRNKKLVKLPFKPDEDNMGVLDFNEKFLVDDWTKVFNRYGFNYFLNKKQFIKIREVFELK